MANTPPLTTPFGSVAERSSDAPLPTVKKIGATFQTGGGGGGGAGAGAGAGEGDGAGEGEGAGAGAGEGEGAGGGAAEGGLVAPWLGSLELPPPHPARMEA